MSGFGTISGDGSTPGKFDRHTIGILEMGIVLSMILHGVILASSVSYYRHYVHDVTYVRVVIGALWLLSTAHASLLLWGLYQITILRLGQPSEWFVMPVTIPLSMAFSSLMQSLVQAVFTYRMWRFSKKIVPSVICWLLATYELVGTLIYSLSYPYSSVAAQTHHQDRYTWLVFSFLSSAAVADAVIAVTTAVHLHRGRDSAVGTNTVRAVDQLETWTLRTGTLTSFLALVIAVNFGLERINNLWLAMYILMTNLYPLTLMTLFLGRRELSLYEEYGIRLDNINLRTLSDHQTRSVSMMENAETTPIQTKRSIASETATALDTNKCLRMRGNEPSVTAVVVSLEVISDAPPSPGPGPTSPIYPPPISTITSESLPLR